MSVLRRLGNVARGKMLEWQRRATGPDADEVLAEERVRRPRPPLDEEEEEEEGEDEDEEPRPPPQPRKRRL